MMLFWVGGKRGRGVGKLVYFPVNEVMSVGLGCMWFNRLMMMGLDPFGGFEILISRFDFFALGACSIPIFDFDFDCIDLRYEMTECTFEQ
jgi:hypothetical protein